MFVVAVGFFWLALFTIVDGRPNSLFSPGVWSTLSAACGALAFARVFSEDLDLRRLAVSATICYGLARGFAYALDGGGNPIGVWTIVAGLALKDWSRNGSQ